MMTMTVLKIILITVRTLQTPIRVTLMAMELEMFVIIVRTTQMPIKEMMMGMGKVIVVITAT